MSAKVIYVRFMSDFPGPIQGAKRRLLKSPSLHFLVDFQSLIFGADLRFTSLDINLKSNQ